jgi:GNAT superfamily N-acetyltransferase
MSLYADYKKEREGKHVIESDRGFIVYFKEKDYFYIEDIYVVPEFRRTHAATEMADWVCSMAKEAGIKKIMGSVVPTTNGANISLRTMLAYGMRLHSAQNNIIFFQKDL